MLLHSHIITAQGKSMGQHCTNVFFYLSWTHGHSRLATPTQVHSCNCISICHRLCYHEYMYRRFLCVLWVLDCEAISPRSQRRNGRIHQQHYLLVRNSCLDFATAYSRSSFRVVCPPLVDDLSCEGCCN